MCRDYLSRVRYLKASCKTKANCILSAHQHTETHGFFRYHFFSFYFWSIVMLPCFCTHWTPSNAHVKCDAKKKWNRFHWQPPSAWVDIFHYSRRIRVSLCSQVVKTQTHSLEQNKRRVDGRRGKKRRRTVWFDFGLQGGQKWWWKINNWFMGRYGRVIVRGWIVLKLAHRKVVKNALDSK